MEDTASTAQHRFLSKIIHEMISSSPLNKAGVLQYYYPGFWVPESQVEKLSKLGRTTESLWPSQKPCPAFLHLPAPPLWPSATWWSAYPSTGKKTMTSAPRAMAPREIIFFVFLPSQFFLPFLRKGKLSSAPFPVLAVPGTVAGEPVRYKFPSPIPVCEWFIVKVQKEHGKGKWMAY